MKRIYLFLLFCECLLVVPNRVSAQFAHPGIFSSTSELRTMRANINGSTSHPMTVAYNAMINDPELTNLNYTPQPLADVMVQESVVTEGERRVRFDANRVYALSLRWVRSRDSRYANKAKEILNAWSNTFVRFTVASGTATKQTYLEAAWTAPMWVAGAEIIRHYRTEENVSAGWSSADVAKFSGFLDKMYTYLDNIDGATSSTNYGNWCASACMARMAIGVFQNNQARYDQGVAFYDVFLQRFVSTTGEVAETCRDSDHPQYTLNAFQQAAEIAWHQGVDLYDRKYDGESTPRLLKTLEFMADMLRGINRSTVCGGSKNWGGKSVHPVYEIGLNHYQNRKGITTATLSQLVLANRPLLIHPLFAGFSTVTHARLNNSSAARVAAASGEIRAEDMTIRLYPNPGNSHVMLDFTVQTVGVAQVIVFDPLARPAITRSESVLPGPNRMVLDVSDLHTGTYLIRLTADGRTTAQKMLILK